MLGALCYSHQFPKECELQARLFRTEAGQLERKWVVNLSLRLAPVQECPVAQNVPHIPRTVWRLERRPVSESESPGFHSSALKPADGGGCMESPVNTSS